MRTLGFFAATFLLALPAFSAETGSSAKAQGNVKAGIVARGKSTPKTTSAKKPIAKPAVPEPVPQPTPEQPVIPLRPSQLPAVPPRVSFQNGMLTVVAENSTLADIFAA